MTNYADARASEVAQNKNITSSSGESGKVSERFVESNSLQYLPQQDGTNNSNSEFSTGNNHDVHKHIQYSQDNDSPIGHTFMESKSHASTSDEMTARSYASNFGSLLGPSAQKGTSLTDDYKVYSIFIDFDNVNLGRIQVKEIAVEI